MIFSGELVILFVRIRMSRIWGFMAYATLRYQDVIGWLFFGSWGFFRMFL